MPPRRSSRGKQKVEPPVPKKRGRPPKQRGPPTPTPVADDNAGEDLSPEVVVKVAASKQHPLALRLAPPGPARLELARVEQAFFPDPDVVSFFSTVFFPSTC